MTRESLSVWITGGALALALAGCSSSSANWATGDGGGSKPQDATPDGVSPAQDDAGSEVQEDASSAPEDGGLQDGGEKEDVLTVWDAYTPDGADGPVDQPPVVTIRNPPASSSVKLSVPIEIRIIDGDDGLQARTPEIAIDGRVLDLGLTPPTAGDNLFDWSGTYTLPTSGPSVLATGSHVLTVKAWDVAGQMGAASTSFVLDRGGPELTAVSPLDNKVLGGTVTFELRVKDSAGIDDSSVTVELKEIGSGNAVRLQLLRVGGGSATEATFSLGYDTGLLPRHMIWPQIFWRAKDLLGNESTLSYQIGVDNAGPIASLTSAPVTFSQMSEGKWACAHLFDPLGNTQFVQNINGADNPFVPTGPYVSEHYGMTYVTAMDRAVVPQAMFLRARVEDVGNSVTGAAIVPVSLIDHVQLWILPHDQRPLVMGENGKCTRYNPDLNPVGAVELLGSSDRNVLVIDMVPLTQGGVLDYSPYAAPPPLIPGCSQWGIAEQSPPDRPNCHGLDWLSQALYVVNARSPRDQPAIFGLQPVGATNSLTCEGVQFDAYQLPDGWFCAAVVAYDKVGNLGISRPLHMCLNKDWVTGTPCDGEPPGECTLNVNPDGSETHDCNDQPLYAPFSAIDVYRP
jgi:hypothetical protein